MLSAPEIIGGRERGSVATIILIIWGSFLFQTLPALHYKQNYAAWSYSCLFESKFQCIQRGLLPYKWARYFASLIHWPNGWWHPPAFALLALRDPMIMAHNVPIHPLFLLGITEHLTRKVLKGMTHSFIERPLTAKNWLTEQPQLLQWTWKGAGLFRIPL